MERIAPVRRDRFIKISKLPTRTTADLDRSSQQVLHAISGGQITPNEGETLINILSDRRRILETAELEPRLKALEQRSEDRDRR